MGVDRDVKIVGALTGFFVELARDSVHCGAPTNFLQGQLSPWAPAGFSCRGYKASDQSFSLQGTGISVYS